MAEQDLPDLSWDIFVSFASPDHGHAKELTRQLEDQGRKVFLSDQAIKGGSDWRKVLPASVRGSRLVAVLLSSNSAKAHWQSEEILLAIRLQRKGKLIIVPVFVTGPPDDSEDWGFGLNSYQCLDMHDLGWGETADQLGVLLEGSPATRVEPPTDLNDSAERQTIGDLLHGAALRIDRSPQWQPLIEICRSNDNAFFLLHGPKQQNLKYFVTRIWNYLGAETGVYHQMVLVPLKFEYVVPRSAAEWESRLRYGLVGESERIGTVEQILREEVRSKPVFLVFCGEPIARQGAQDAGGLDELEVEALEEFVSDRLPKLIARASKGPHRIRALLATHYDSEDDSLVERLDEGAVRGCKTHDIWYRKLPPVRPLEWHDIEDHLDHFRQRPPKQIYRQLKTEFERIRDDEKLQFRDILDLLARVLG